MPVIHYRACRHGDRCSRIHNKPTISQTLLLQNMYQNPAMSMPPGPDGLPPQINPRESQEHFEVLLRIYLNYCILLPMYIVCSACSICVSRVSLGLHMHLSSLPQVCTPRVEPSLPT